MGLHNFASFWTRKMRLISIRQPTYQVFGDSLGAFNVSHPTCLTTITPWDLFCLQRRLVYERCQEETEAKDLPASVLSTMTSTEMEETMDKMGNADLENLVKKLSKEEQLLNSEQVGYMASPRLTSPPLTSPLLFGCCGP